jgi:GxxExxY protein
LGVLDVNKSLTIEPDSSLDELANLVIGAAIEVHRHLGPGFLEVLYEEALGIELRSRGIPFERQHGIAVSYKNIPIGHARVDLLVSDRLIVEIKAVEALLPIHRAQLISYLKMTNRSLGLLINFNEARLAKGVRRVVLTQSTGLEADEPN